MAGRWRRFRVLTCACWARLVDAGDAGHAIRGAWFWVVAVFSVPAAFIPFMLGQGSGTAPLAGGALPMSAWGWAMIARYRGADVLRALSLTDKTFYLGGAAAVSAFLAALVWSRALPDRRDALVLGPLPVRPSTIVAARLTVLAAVVGLTTVAMHLLASVVFGIELAAGNTVVFALRGIAAHLLASCGVSALVFLAVVGLQGLMLAIAGPRLFARASSLVQGLAIAAAVAGLVAIPVMSASAAETLRFGPAARPWLLWTPPLWFLGVYETVLGTSDPLLHRLAAVACLALAGAIALVFATYPAAYARVIRAAVDLRRASAPRWRTGIPRALSRRLSRRPAVRGIIELFLVTLARSDRHRLVMAATAGLATTWALAGWIALPSATPRLPTAGAFAIPLSLVLVAAFGVRLAADLPAGDRATWIFALADPHPCDGRLALERSMMIVAGLPVVLVTTAIVWMVWGGVAAAAHAVFLVPAAHLAIELALRRWTGIPCTTPWQPDVPRLRRLWPVYLAAFVAFTRGGGAIEAVSMRAVLPVAGTGSRGLPAAWVVLVVAGCLTWMAVSVRRAALRATPDIGDRDTLGILTNALQAGSARPFGRDAGSVRVTRVAIAPSRSESRRSDREPWVQVLRAPMLEVWRDGRLALRRIARAPAFALFAVATLAIGIGATTSAYAVARALTNRPMTVRDPSRVVTLRRSGSAVDLAVSWPDFEDLRAAQHTFAAVEGSSDFPVSLSGRNRTTVVTGTLVTGGYFRALGVAAMVGRALQPADDRADAPPVVVLSESTWRTEFDADPAIVGTAVDVGGRPYVVAGVLPASFRGIHARVRQPAVWVPVVHPPLTDPALAAFRDSARRDRAWVQVVMRLRPGVREDDADRDIRRIAGAMDLAAPSAATLTGPRGRRWTAVSLSADATNDAPSAARAAMVVLPLVVLLLACTNLSNLVLSRGASRRGEVAVRRALGASRWRLIREQLVEHGILALAGGLAGLLVARAGMVYVAAFVQRVLGAGSPYRIDARLDAAVLMAAGAAAGLAVVVAGLVPAIQLTRATAPVVSASNAATPRWRGRAALISVQVAACLALLLVAALGVRSARAASSARRFRADLAPVGAVRLATSLRTHDRADVDRLIERVLDAVRSTPGVRGAAAVSNIPGGARSASAMTSTIDRPFDGATRGVDAEIVHATPGVLAVLGVPIVAGRPFTLGDAAASHPVAIVSRAEARALFGATDVVGRDVLVDRGNAGTPDIRTGSIVGVADDDATDARGDPRRTIYMPFAQRPAADPRMLSPETIVVARADGEGAAAAALLQSAVRRVDPDLAVTAAGPATLIAEAPAAAVLPLIARLAAALALVALVLAMLGLYGVVSHLATARTRELGIRVALGASRARILRLMLVDGSRPVAAGLAAGLVLAAVARLLLQVATDAAGAAPGSPASVAQAFDTVVVLLAAAPLVGAAVVACWIPAARAARVDPNVALRDG
jgi:predicted permease